MATEAPHPGLRYASCGLGMNGEGMRLAAAHHPYPTMFGALHRRVLVGQAARAAPRAVPLAAPTVAPGL